MNISAFFITLVSGLSFIIGYIITRAVHNKKKLVVFSIGFAFSVLIGLIILDLLPECFELFDKWYYILLCVLGGGILLKLLDLVLPHHEHSHSHSHIEHISIMSCVAIFLHNIIEATAIYTTSVSSLKAGILMALGVSCHNIPLGIQVSSLTNSKKSSAIMSSLLAFSSIFGVLVITLFNIPLSDNVLGILIGLTVGMLIYIITFELFCEVKEHIKQKEMLAGIFFGAVVIVLAMMF